MDKISSENIATLFKNLCCSQCKNDFSIEDIKILERHKNILTCHLLCQKCGKDFGKIILNFERKQKKHTPLQLVEGAEPISYDDVIDAHNFIKNNL